MEKRIAGLVIWLLKCRLRMLLMSGVNQLQMKNMKNYKGDKTMEYVKLEIQV